MAEAKIDDWKERGAGKGEGRKAGRWEAEQGARARERLVEGGKQRGDSREEAGRKIKREEQNREQS